MSMQQQITQKITQGLGEVNFLEVVNESHGHRVAPGSETHFKLTIVSPDFNDLKPLARHRKIYQILAEELRQGVHALALHTYSPAEWQGQAPNSPPCLGGSKQQ